MSSSCGSFVEASRCAARKKRRSWDRAASSDAIDLSRPTNRGATMWGNTTMSRNGSSGRILFLSSIRPSAIETLRQLGLLALDDLRGDPAVHDVFGNDALLDVALGRDLVHDVEHDVLEDGPEAARARLPLDRLPRDGAQRLLRELQLDVLEVEEPLVLADQGVLRPREDLDQRVLVELVQGRRHGKAPDELGDEAELDEVLRLDGLEDLADALLGLGHDVGRETHRLLRGAALDDAVQSHERPPADEEDVGRVDLDEVLLRMLAAPLRRHVGDRPLQELEERLLDPLPGDVAGDGRVLR